MSAHTGYVLYKEGAPVGLLIAPGATNALKRASRFGIVADEARRANENLEDYRFIVENGKPVEKSRRHRR